MEFSCARCGYKRDEYRIMSFKGIIIKKFQDKNSHIMWKLLIKEQENEFEFMNNSFSDSYLYAEAGDSIIKVEDSLKITIIKKNGEKRDFRYDYE